MQLGKQGAHAEPDWDPSRLGERLLGAAEKFLDDVLATNQATGARAPFFMHFCTDGAHSPYVPAERIRGTALKGRTNLSPHTDMVWETDVLLGKLMEMLERRDVLGGEPAPGSVQAEGGCLRRGQPLFEVGQARAEHASIEL